MIYDLVLSRLTYYYVCMCWNWSWNTMQSCQCCYKY